MSGEALKQEIRKGAEEKAALTLTEARSKAEQIMADAEVQAKRLLETRLEAAHRRLEQVERSEAAKARMECTRRVLVLQSRYVDQAFAEAESMLRGIPASDQAGYGNTLRRFIAEAVEALGSSTLVALVRAPDKKLVETVLRSLGGDSGASSPPPKVSISGEPLESMGGIVLLTPDERSYFVNTFESRLLRAREELRAKVTETLLGRE